MSTTTAEWGQVRSWEIARSPLPPRVSASTSMFPSSRRLGFDLIERTWLKEETPKSKPGACCQLWLTSGSTSWGRAKRSAYSCGDFGRRERAQLRVEYAL